MPKSAKKKYVTEYLHLPRYNLQLFYAKLALNVDLLKKICGISNPKMSIFKIRRTHGTFFEKYLNDVLQGKINYYPKNGARNQNKMHQYPGFRKCCHAELLFSGILSCRNNFFRHFCCPRIMSYEDCCFR